jgi:hypothetical protein
MNTWKEIYCLSITADLFINNVFAGISLFNGWFISLTNESLFDNTEMLNKIYQSNIIKKKYNVKKLKLNCDNNLDDLNNLSNSSQIQLNLTLSNLSLVLNSQYNGRTLSFVLLTNNTILYGNILTDIKLFKRYIFDIVYGLYCLNSLKGIIHGDLHLNNCTINIQHSLFNDDNVCLIPVDKLHNIDKTKYAKNISPCIHYNVSDIINMKSGNSIDYVFTHRGAYACIIDFSRAVLDPTMHSIDLTNLRQFILFNLKQQFSEFHDKYENASEIKSNQITNAINKYPAEMFKIATAFDTYNFARMVYAYISDDLADMHHIIPEIFTFLKDLIKISSDLIQNGIELIISHINSNEIKHINSHPFPNYTIIKTLFEDCTVKYASNDTLITDTYTFGELKYSLSSNSQLPPFLKGKAKSDDKRPFAFDKSSEKKHTQDIKKIYLSNIQ